MAATTAPSPALLRNLIRAQSDPADAQIPISGDRIGGTENHSQARNSVPWNPILVDETKVLDTKTNMLIT